MARGYLHEAFLSGLKNLTSGTFGWMLEHSSHRAVIVADDDINDKEAIIEGILYHLQNCRSLHTF